MKFQKISEEHVRKILETVRIDSPRYDEVQFLKYTGIDRYVWICCFDDSNEPAALATVCEDNPEKGTTYVAEIQAFRKGNGFGTALLDFIKKTYVKVWLMCDVHAGDSLKRLYRRSGMIEFIVPESIYDCPASFFRTRQVDGDMIEAYVKQCFSKNCFS